MVHARVKRGEDRIPKSHLKVIVINYEFFVYTDNYQYNCNSNTLNLFDKFLQLPVVAFPFQVSGLGQYTGQKKLRGH